MSQTLRLATGLLLSLAVACGGTAEPGDAPMPAPADAGGADDEPTAPPQSGEAPDDADPAPRVAIETSKGKIVVELDRDKAPITVENFLRYVEDEFYAGTVFHRVMKDFMIQGGGFTPDGRKKRTRDPIVLEDRNGLTHVRGAIAMARTSVPNSATAQFFINTVDNSWRWKDGPGYAVFGKVVEGMDVIDAIRAVATTRKDSHGNWPVENVTIGSAKRL